MAARNAAHKALGHIFSPIRELNLHGIIPSSPRTGTCFEVTDLPFFLDLFHSPSYLTRLRLAWSETPTFTSDNTLYPLVAALPPSLRHLELIGPHLFRQPALPDAVSQAHTPRTL
jgi:hypothetical protein